MTINSIVKGIYALIAGVLFLAACNHSEPAPTGTAGNVTCFEDEVAVPRTWVPGTPKDGVLWDCVHVDLFLDTVYPPEPLPATDVEVYLTRFNRAS